MAKELLKFEDIPLVVPSKKILSRKLEKFVADLKECGSAKTALPVIKKFAKFNDELNTDLTVIQIRYSLDTTNPKYEHAQNVINEILPELEVYFMEWNKTLAKAKYRKDLEKELGKYYFQMIDNSLRTFSPEVVPLLVEENKLSSKYDQVMGSAQIDFRGEKYNLSQMGKFTVSKDRETRKAASEALDGWLGEHEEEIGGIYDKLVHIRDEIAHKLGFKNFVELGYLRLGRVDYDAKKVKNYRKQIHEVAVPLCQKLYKKQAKRLGYKQKDMRSYDYNIDFLSGNPTPKGDEAYLVEQAGKMYDEMSNETSVFFRFMREYHLLDLTARPGKAPGGYMTYLPKYKMPFIFSNFNGTSGDVDVLTHEVGHAFQGYMSSKIKIPEYRSPTYEACEIHSMSMEFFAYPWMESFFKEDKEKYIYTHLSGALEFLPYGITIDEFQHWVYEHPNATHEERCAEFKRIHSSNEPHLNFEGLPTYNKGGYWMRQSHVFGSPFYYIDYTLAQVVALQFFNEMRKNREKAWKKYVKLCKCGGSLPFVALLEKNHLRNPFEDGNVAKAFKPAYKFLNDIDDTVL